MIYEPTLQQIDEAFYKASKKNPMPPKKIPDTTKRLQRYKKYMKKDRG